jgi:hypothetical protein
MVAAEDDAAEHAGLAHFIESYFLGGAPPPARLLCMVIKVLVFAG